jgi:type III restriction enzyme
MLDNDDTGRIKWWLRNLKREKWATLLILLTGNRFFPDFVVGVSGRRTRDSFALVEIKDDGETGLLHSDSNAAVKIRCEHSEYKKVFWSFREAEGVFLKAVWNQSYNRISAPGHLRLGTWCCCNSTRARVVGHPKRAEH